MTPEWWHDTGLVAQWLRALDAEKPLTVSQVIRCVEKAHTVPASTVRMFIDMHLDELNAA